MFNTKTRFKTFLEALAASFHIYFNTLLLGNGFLSFLLVTMAAIDMNAMEYLLVSFLFLLSLFHCTWSMMHPITNWQFIVIIGPLMHGDLCCHSSCCGNYALDITLLLFILLTWKGQRLLLFISSCGRDSLSCQEMSFDQLSIRWIVFDQQTPYFIMS